MNVVNEQIHHLRVHGRVSDVKYANATIYTPSIQCVGELLAKYRPVLLSGQSWAKIDQSLCSFYC